VREKDESGNCDGRKRGKKRVGRFGLPISLICNTSGRFGFSICHTKRWNWVQQHRFDPNHREQPHQYRETGNRLLTRSKKKRKQKITMPRPGKKEKKRNVRVCI
jgi:hypothetical protein